MTNDMLERVARKILDEIKDQDGFVVDISALARAAIAEMLDGLAEPTAAMREAFVEKAMQVQLSSTYTWGDYAADQWKAMLAAFRAEINFTPLKEALRHDQP